MTSQFIYKNREDIFMPLAHISDELLYFECVNFSRKSPYVFFF